MQWCLLLHFWTYVAYNSSNNHCTSGYNPSCESGYSSRNFKNMYNKLCQAISAYESIYASYLEAKLKSYKYLQNLSKQT